MNQSRLVKLVICCVTTLLLAGCVWGGYDGYHGDDRHERGRGDPHGDDHRDHDGDR